MEFLVLVFTIAVFDFVASQYSPYGFYYPKHGNYNHDQPSSYINKCADLFAHREPKERSGRRKLDNNDHATERNRHNRREATRDNDDILLDYQPEANSAGNDPPSIFEHEGEQPIDKIKVEDDALQTAYNKRRRVTPVAKSAVSEDDKALTCAMLPCVSKTNIAVCACNFVTGNVVTFKNDCDVEKHNCRYNTDFHVILPEICPWEFQSRRSHTVSINYNDPKYYN